MAMYPVVSRTALPIIEHTCLYALEYLGMTARGNSEVFLKAFVLSRLRFQARSLCVLNFSFATAQVSLLMHSYTDRKREQVLQLLSTNNDE